MHQLPTVAMDDCFMTLCPNRTILQEDFPSFSAPCATMHAPRVATSATSNMTPWSIGDPLPAPPQMRRLKPIRPRFPQDGAPSIPSHACIQLPYFNGGCTGHQAIVLTGMLVLVIAAALVVRPGRTQQALRRMLSSSAAAAAAAAPASLKPSHNPATSMSRSLSCELLQGFSSPESSKDC